MSEITNVKEVILDKKLIIFDIDGTLHNNESQRELGSSTISLLNEINKIIPITFASGRYVTSALSCLKNFNFKYPLVCANGSTVYNPVNKEMIKQKTFSAEIVNRIYKEYSNNFYFASDIGSEIYTCSRKSKILYSISFGTDSNYIKCNLKKMLESNSSTLILMPKYKDFDLPIGHLNSIVNPFEVKLQNGTNYIEIKYCQSNKFCGVQTLREFLSLDDKDILAFGNDENDIELFKSVGTSVAVENALEILKENATFTLQNSINDFLEESLYLLKSKKGAIL
ncbi:Cof-type HAD-IIB family hydrolase [Bacillus cereus]|nr:Cof-type HAD-IIB family hydrolase [Bacillus cereus]